PRIVNDASSRLLVAAEASEGAFRVTTTSTDECARANAGEATTQETSAAKPQMKTPRLKTRIVAVPSWTSVDAKVSAGGRGRLAPAVARPGDRQLDPERRADAERRLDVDLAPHPPQELAADVEAEAGAADAPPEVRVEAVELLEDPLLLVERDSEPG